MNRMKISAPVPFNHCATVVADGNSVFVAHYGGKQECNADQHVIVTQITDGVVREQFHLEERTGNPVFFKDGAKIRVGYSYFERMDTKNVVARWAYCSLRVRELQRDGTGFELGDPAPVFKDHPQIGFLFRCAPLNHGGATFLPMYHEGSRYGVVGKWVDDHVRVVGKIGRKCRSLIQPTLWFDGEKFHALCRNMAPSTYGNCSWYSSSPNLRIWSPPLSEESVTNYNNSLVVVNDGKPDPLIVWNQGRDRSKLCLGKLYGHSLGRDFCKLNKGTSGSYPNYCFDDAENLHLVWTDMNRAMGQCDIMLLTLTNKEYLKLRDQKNGPVSLVV
ncbi:MAG: hypothetical protein Q8K86_11505 [Candidatus Nanopelagicaceae bacterium]|nr:hypothetical protein [Candidatus Nanopelagicaceae bacterium]